mgnify:CR=1 FL=1
MRIEWPTLILAIACYALWAVGVFILPQVSLLLAVAVTAWAAAQHSSLSHEALHGHPFGNRRLNEALVFPALSLCTPYGRFRDTHLAHHNDSRLTDPYDDPETAYCDPVVWARLPQWQRKLLTINNTLAGRIVLGPLIGMVAFVRSDIRAARAGERVIVSDWALHIPGVVLTLWAVSFSGMGFGAYFAACYCALSMLKIRTFLEHQAHARVSGRTAIVEDRGVLGFLFLNNNLHVVHHMHPRVAWYKLWPLYRAQKERFVTRNHGYVYSSYADVFRQYLWRPKEAVAHPLMPAPED